MPSGRNDNPGKTLPAKRGWGREVCLFSAVSLDGFIAAADGGIDWLFHDQDYGYREFYSSVDAVLVGRKTYDQALTLAQNPFEGKQAYVFTHSGGRIQTAGVEFIRDDPAAFTRAFKGTEGGRIWLVGGGEINGLLMIAGLVDQMVLSIHPIVLGAGRPLFGVEAGARKYLLEGSKTWPSGLAQLTYRLAR
jgi:dihydrofolate reductase